MGRLLGKAGNFGITYLGWDRLLRRKVAIKEYLPRELASRPPGDPRVLSHSVEDARAFDYGREKFVEEARILAHLDHPNIVRVQRFFEENGTAYLVMDYSDGVSLDQHLEDGKWLPETEAVALLLPILEALSHIHAKGLVHRDVKPSNIYLKGGRTPILLDFGAARTALGERTKNLSVLLSPGYAPIEQYSANGQLGPWTDVYAAAATLYRMLTGKGPLDSNSRYEEDKLEPPDQLVPGLSPRLSQIVLIGLAIKRQDRIQNAEVFSGLLRRALEVSALVAPKPVPSTVDPKPAQPAPTPSTAPTKQAPLTTAPKTTPNTAAPLRGALSSPLVLQGPRTSSVPVPRRTLQKKAAEKPAEMSPGQFLIVPCALMAILFLILGLINSPLAIPDHADMNGEEKVVISVLENDLGLWSHLSLVSVSAALHGTTSLGPGDTVTYTPEPGYSGEDRFNYTVANSWGSDRAAIVVTVLSGTQRP